MKLLILENLEFYPQISFDFFFSNLSRYFGTHSKYQEKPNYAF